MAAAPCFFVFRDIKITTLFERVFEDNLGLFRLARGAFRVFGIQWIDTRAQLDMGLPGFVARLGEANRVLASSRTKSHFPGAPIDHISEQPKLLLGASHVQVQVSAVRVPSRRSPGFDPGSGQSLGLTRHCRSPWC